jgi:HEAT repeat protein
MRTHMKKHSSTPRKKRDFSTFADLAVILADDDGFDRSWARARVVELGKPAVHELIDLTFSPDDQLRWEATKALIEIRDPSAGDALVGRLSDENMEVRWLAAEALIALRSDALIPLLRALQRNFDSVFLREGARHIFRALNHENLLNETTTRLLRGLLSHEPPVYIALTAHAALTSLMEQAPPLA